MKARPIALALLVAFAPAAFPRTALAQDDPVTKAARARFQEGVSDFDKGHFEAARAAFLEAYALKQHPAVLLNLAQSCLKSSHYLDAAKYFQKYLQDPQGDKKAEATKGLTDARVRLGRLDVTAPPGSEVIVDTDTVGKTPLNEAVDVEAGNHTVRARLPDGSSSEQKIVVTAGQLQPVRFAAAATVLQPTNPATTNPESPTLPANPATTSPETPKPQTQTSNAIAPTPQGPVVHPTGGLVLMIAGGVLTVGGFAGAAAFGALKSTANQNLQSVETTITNAANADGLSTKGLCNNPPSKYASACSTLKTDQNAVNQDATAANTLLVVGIVGVPVLIGGIVWYFVGAKHQAATTAHVTPWVAPGSGGLSLSGTF